MVRICPLELIKSQILLNTINTIQAWLQPEENLIDIDMLYGVFEMTKYKIEGGQGLKSSVKLMVASELIHHG